MKFLFYSYCDEVWDIHLKKDVYGFSRGFAKAGYESTFVSGKIKNKPVPGIKYVETGNVSKSPFSILRDFFPFMKILNEERPDVVMFFHGNILLPFIVFLFTLLEGSYYKITRTSTRVIWTLKVDYSGKITPNQTKLMYLLSHIGYVINSVFVSYVVVENSCVYSAFSKFIIQSGKLRTVPISYSSDYQTPIRYDPSTRKKRILSVGRIQREMGLITLVNAFGNIRGHFEEWDVMICGPVEDFDYYEEVRGLISRLGLEKNVVLRDYVSNNELMQLYMSSSIYCRPSLSYGNEAVRIEAAIYGLPVVTSDTGCPEYFQSLGMKIFKAGDENDLRRVLTELMSNDQLRVEISEKQQKNIKPFEELVSEFAKEINSVR
jgi:glycosyltransferase involved in cell wall biosynthesis